MIDAIIKEMQCTESFTGERIETIYFGGGTPSLLTSVEMESLIRTLRNKFDVCDLAEVTLEANPDDINPDTLQEWQRLGINRLSVGIQSFQENELRWMNRAHNSRESMQCIEEVIKSGFTNFSVDLIYGSPLLSDDDFKKNVETIFSYNVPHISCYALTVEPKTALDALIRQKKTEPVDSDKQSRHFTLLIGWMKAAGYEHYEISNFSKPGMYSRHNSSYWSGSPYYGFGPSAHSFNGTDTRKWNIANNALYVQSLKKGEILATAEVLTAAQRLNEYIMISLRTSNGINLETVTEKFGPTFKTTLAKQAAKHLENGTLVNERERILLTDKGKLLADGIAADLFF